MNAEERAEFSLQSKFLCKKKTGLIRCYKKQIL